MAKRIENGYRVTYELAFIVHSSDLFEDPLVAKSNMP